MVAAGDQTRNRRWGPPRGERYSIAQLVATTSVPASTIHSYLRLGLLPDPVRPSRNRFVYDDRHASGLRIIRRLRRRDLPVDEIRRAVPDLLAVAPDDLEDAIDELMERRARDASPRAKLIGAALDVFGTHGYRDVSITSLCERAEIGKGSFYRHFTDKDELLLSAARAVVEQIVAGFGSDAAGAESPPTAQALARHLRPGLPLLLELAERALQAPDTMAGPSAELFATLARRLGQVAGMPGDIAQAGGMLVLLAVVDIFGELVEPLVTGRSG